MKYVVRRRLLAAAIAVSVTALALVLARAAGGWFFSFYPAVSRAAMYPLAALCSVFPFAVWEGLAAGLALFALIRLAQAIRRRRVAQWLTGLLLGAALGVSAFVLLWGLNHYAPPIGERLGLDVREYSVEELTAATLYYLGAANDEAQNTARLSGGEMAPADFSALARQAGEGYETLAQGEPSFRGCTLPVKRVTLWPVMSRFGITGIFVCLTGESSVNPDTYTASLPFTMCHEIGHRMAVAAENEANFCAYLACEASSRPAFRYSGAYCAFIYCYNALHRAAPDKARAVWASASDEVIADCRAANAHYQKYEGKVQDAAQKVNDTYLKAFSEESGVQSYGEVADLLIAWYLKKMS